MATHALQHPSQEDAQRRPSEPFLKIPHSLLMAKAFVSRATGEAVELSLTNRILWAWMKCCHDSYTGKGRTYHAAQKSIAAACGVSVDSVKRAMVLFEKHGYLIKKTTVGVGSVWSLPHELDITCTANAESNPAPAVAVAVSAANDDADADAELDALLGPARSYSAPQEQNGASACTPDVADEYAAMPVDWWESGLPPESR